MFAEAEEARRLLERQGDAESIRVSGWDGPDGLPLPRRTETMRRLGAELATATSSWPSPLKSASASEMGAGPASYPRAGWKAPSPLPRRTERVPLVKSLPPELATTRSRLPSASTSAMATARVEGPAWKTGAVRKADEEHPGAARASTQQEMLNKRARAPALNGVSPELQRLMHE
jgi:hypothetical protein